MRHPFSIAGPRKTSADIKAEIADAGDAAKAILDAAAAEGRDLTEAEMANFDGHLAAIEVNREELKVVQTAEESRRLQVARHSSTKPFGSAGAGHNPYGTPMTADRIAHKLPKLTAFKNTPEGQRDAWLAGNWWKAIRTGDEAAKEICAAHGIDIRGTMTEGNPGGGGYLVPTPLSNAIIEVRDAVGVARRTAQVQPMDADTLSVPKLLSGPTVRYVGEAQEIEESDETWGQIGLTARKRAILTKISRELRDDSIIAIMDQLASRMGYEFALNEDREFILGDGTSDYGGEVGLVSALGAGGVVTAATGHDTWGEIDSADLTAWMAALPSRYRPGAAIITSPAFYAAAILRVMVAGGGNTMQSLSDGVGTASFLGVPVYFTDFLPTATAAATVAALFGNFRQAAMIGSRQGVEIQVSDQRYFEHDLVGIKGTTRYDILVHEPGTASAAGAYVALKTAS